MFRKEEIMKNIMQRGLCVIIMITWLVFLPLMGCTEDKAKELFETAKLEELQNSPDQARQLYQEIIKAYPDSEYAERARGRLSALRD